MSAINYVAPGPVAASFMRANALVRCLRGPIGSGKSGACAVELFRRACQQKPDQNGVRPSRAIIVRNTNTELRNTTIKTWLEWFPEEEFGDFRWTAPFTHHVRKPLGDGTSLDFEVIFLPLDTELDIKRLLSAEPTFIWINEAREIPKAIVDAATSRISLDRFPPRRRVKPTWRGLIMDTNAPPEEHWWAIVSGEVPVPKWMTEADRLTMIKPKEWKFFTQPPGMFRVRDNSGTVIGYEANPKAENTQNVGGYEQMIQGKSEAWIAVYVLNEYGRVGAGKLVYDGYTRRIHVAPGPLEVNPNTMLDIGVDFGLSPAAAVLQAWGLRVAILKELIGRDIGAKRFASRLQTFLAQNFPGHYPHMVRLWGDPAGDHRAETDETTPFQIFRGAGFLIRPAPSNDPLLRVEAVNRQLGLLEEGQPGLIIDPSCVTIIAGFDGGYAYPARHSTSGFDAPSVDKVDKSNPFSHPHDAVQAALLGMGMGKAVVGRQGQAVPVLAKRTGSLFSRRARRRPFGDRR